MPHAFLNGEFLDPADARVAALDAGLQHGVGLFETMLGGVNPAQGGGAGPGGAWVMMLDEHLARLATSAAELGLSSRLQTGALADAVLSTVARAGRDEGHGEGARLRVRVTITGGGTDALRAARQPGQPPHPEQSPERQATVLVVASPASVYPPGMIERGVMACVADAKANPFNPTEGHKTLNYWWRLRELAAASRKGAAEGLVFSVLNQLCGGCVSNAFVVKDDEVFTPVARGEEVRAAREAGEQAARDADTADASAGAGGIGAAALPLPSPVLPGTVREWVINELAGEGVVVRRRGLTIHDVLSADEVLLTNSSWGVLPVVRVEGATVGPGTPGPMAGMLAERWQLAIEQAAAGII